MLFKLIIQFILGIGVGIYGYLVPSYINLGVFQISMSHSRNDLRKVLLIISLVEIPYCFVCMSAMDWIMEQQVFLLFVRWLIVVVLLVMAFFTWKKALKIKSEETKEEQALVTSDMKRLILYAIFNPFQLSAWAIWGTYFVEKSWFEWTSFSIFIFSIGASLGVLIILWLYAIMGKKLVSMFSSHRKQIDFGIAGILFLLGIVQLIRNLI